MFGTNVSLKLTIAIASDRVHFTLFGECCPLFRMLWSTLKHIGSHVHALTHRTVVVLTSLGVNSKTSKSNRAHHHGNLSASSRHAWCMLNHLRGCETLAPANSGCISG